MSEHDKTILATHLISYQERPDEEDTCNFSLSSGEPPEGYEREEQTAYLRLTGVASVSVTLGSISQLGVFSEESEEFDCDNRRVITTTQTYRIFAVRSRTPGTGYAIAFKAGCDNVCTSYTIPEPTEDMCEDFCDFAVSSASALSDEYDERDKWFKVTGEARASVSVRCTLGTLHNHGEQYEDTESFNCDSEEFETTREFYILYRIVSEADGAGAIIVSRSSSECDCTSACATYEFTADEEEEEEADHGITLSPDPEYSNSGLLFGQQGRLFAQVYGSSYSGAKISHGSFGVTSHSPTTRTLTETLGIAGDSASLSFRPDRITSMVWVQSAEENPLPLYNPDTDQLEWESPVLGELRVSYTYTGRSVTVSSPSGAGFDDSVSVTVMAFNDEGDFATSSLTFSPEDVPEEDEDFDPCDCITGSSGWFGEDAADLDSSYFYATIFGINDKVFQGKVLKYNFCPEEEVPPEGEEVCAGWETSRAVVPVSVRDIVHEGTLEIQEILTAEGESASTTSPIYRFIGATTYFSDSNNPLSVSQVEGGCGNELLVSGATGRCGAIIEVKYETQFVVIRVPIAGRERQPGHPTSWSDGTFASAKLFLKTFEEYPGGPECCTVVDMTAGTAVPDGNGNGGPA